MAKNFLVRVYGPNGSPEQASPKPYRCFGYDTIEQVYARARREYQNHLLKVYVTSDMKEWELIPRTR